MKRQVRRRPGAKPIVLAALGAGLAGLVLLAAGQGGLLRLLLRPPAAVAGGTPVMPPDSSPERGRVLYAENCASCHGARLEGQEDWQTPGPDGILPAPPHDAAGHTWHHGDGILFDYVSLGGARALEKRGIAGFRSGMPGFSAALTEQEIWDILAYIKSNWPERIRALQASQTEAERERGD